MIINVIQIKCHFMSIKSDVYAYIIAIYIYALYYSMKFSIINHHDSIYIYININIYHWDKYRHL